MVRAEVAELHAQRLASMCSGLGISVEQYFALHNKYGYRFDHLVNEALHCKKRLIDMRGKDNQDMVLNLPAPKQSTIFRKFG